MPLLLLQMRRHSTCRGHRAMYLGSQAENLSAPSPAFHIFSVMEPSHPPCFHLIHIHPTGPGALSSRSPGVCASTAHGKDVSGTGALPGAPSIKMSSHINNCFYWYSYLLQDEAWRRQKNGLLMLTLDPRVAGDAGLANQWLRWEKTPGRPVRLSARPLAETACEGGSLSLAWLKVCEPAATTTLPITEKAKQGKQSKRWGKEIDSKPKIRTLWTCYSLETMHSCYMFKPMWIGFLSLTTKTSRLTLSFPPWPLLVTKEEMCFMERNLEDTILTKVSGSVPTVVGWPDIMCSCCHIGEVTQHYRGGFLAETIWHTGHKEADPFLNINVLKTNGPNISQGIRLMKNRRKWTTALHWGDDSFIMPEGIL